MKFYYRIGETITGKLRAVVAYEVGRGRAA